MHYANCARCSSELAIEPQKSDSASLARLMHGVASEANTMMNFSLTTIATGLILASAACASTPGARPTDMSEQQHERMAGQAETRAAQHAGQYDAAASVSERDCTANENGTAICWASAVNPTAAHIEDARRHQKMAADHRAAAQTLRTAETTSCRDVALRDRDMSPFHHRENILRVDPIENHTIPEFLPDTLGTVIVVRPTPGLTAARLQSLVDCHLARNAAMGFEMASMQSCPLSVKGARARVTKAKDGNLAVAISAKDAASGDEINRRARSLR